MFSMFFGAGNVVFPLKLGQISQSNNIYAILGLLITAVGVPFLGLISMTLFNGDYKKFFGRIGKVPGFMIAFLIMALIGPFGALPRCIALSYSTTKMFFPSIGIEMFSLCACLLIFILTFKKNSIVDLLGYVLTPLLLGSLGVIIVKGLFLSPHAPITEAPPIESFFHGFMEGYQTMDLLGAFFFSSIVISCMKKGDHYSKDLTRKELLILMGKSSLIGAALLSLIYTGFSYVAAYNSNALAHVGTDQLLGQVALSVLGPYAGVVACVAVALACLTTAIALACVFAEFVHFEIAQGKIGYLSSLVITLVISYFVSVMNFVEIVKLLAPILQMIYPSLIALSVINLFYKLYGYQQVYAPLVIVFVLSVADFLLW